MLLSFISLDQRFLKAKNTKALKKKLIITMPFAGRSRLIFYFEGPPYPLYKLKVEKVGMNSKILFNISLLQWVKESFSSRKSLTYGLKFYKDFLCHLNFADYEEEEKTWDSSWGHRSFKSLPGNSCDASGITMSILLFSLSSTSILNFWMFARGHTLC